ncbi:MAG: phosphocholine cytidylyltransferase/choline kinase family protein [Clostridiales bacterium]|nr:phosphocholine cytidylyltransferase/choline kinase family protein [Clostridiales bacterium]
MNKRDWIVLAVLANYSYLNHREIVRRTGFSIGLVNSSLKKLLEEGYIDNSFRITEKTVQYMEGARPQRAVILAAGMGHRMVPINRVPKGLLKINNEPLIERIIRQLHDVSVTEIHVVVGYMMEKLEYLMDAFGVELIYDHEFADRDSLHTLRLASGQLSNCYIVPSNVWISRNPFSRNEFFSWYAVSEYVDDDSFVRLNRKMELVYTEDESAGNSMTGLCYLMENEAAEVREQVVRLDRQRRFYRETWERALFSGSKMLPYARVMLGQTAYVINTYEELRELDSESKDLRSRRMSLIGEVFGVTPEDITDISGLFKGMTNRLMRFSVAESPYILRVPGEGSNELINRRQEAEVYRILADKNFSDKVVYISPEDGYKIAEYWTDARVCDIQSDEDVGVCMRHLRKLHEMKLQVSHSFDLLERLEHYESLRDGEPQFSDYEDTKEKILELTALLGVMPKEKCLCHIDAVSDNFVFIGDQVYLIDWEYSGMCDPHIDIAMFCLYADYDKNRADRVIDQYFGGEANDLDYFKVYAYAAAGGLLWSVWCEYKDKMGVNYGDYAMRQYRYAKRFHQYAKRFIEKALNQLEV